MQRPTRNVQSSKARLSFFPVCKEYGELSHSVRNQEKKGKTEPWTWKYARDWIYGGSCHRYKLIQPEVVPHLPDEELRLRIRPLPKSHVRILWCTIWSWAVLDQACPSHSIRLHPSEKRYQTVAWSCQHSGIREAGGVVSKRTLGSDQDSTVSQKSDQSQMPQLLKNVLLVSNSLPKVSPQGVQVSTEPRDLSTQWGLGNWDSVCETGV